MTLRAPFPYFGGKRRVADLVWSRLGDTPNYVEPFAGSLAVLLGRPSNPRIETVNDLDAYVANFWRALSADPDLVAQWADWPVNEADLHARHTWLMQQQAAGFRERMMSDPEYYDPQVAGWWVWGISQWIGSGWCRTDRTTDESWRGRFDRQPKVDHKRPRLDRGGRGVSRQIPCLHGDSGATGRGVRASALARRGGLYAWMSELADRLRNVRVCCGDWKRILGPSPTTCIGTTAVLLDPPYGAAAERTARIYAMDSMTIADDVRRWCQEHADDPNLRIALCGYVGEHDELEAQGWDVVAWKAHGGYAKNDNAAKERIWFSPACLSADVDAQQTITGVA